MIVTVGCLCPSTSSGEVRHPDGDAITLRERLDFRSAVIMQKSVTALRTEVEDPSTAEILAVLTEAYVLHGIASWTIVDVKGKGVPVTRQSIETYLLSNLPAAMSVADAADELYQDTVLLPLLRRAAGSSGTSPTTPSTSPATSSQPEPPKPLKRSSTTTSRTAATGTTSPLRDGDSNSSQSSVSAA